MEPYRAFDPREPSSRVAELELDPHHSRQAYPAEHQAPLLNGARNPRSSFLKLSHCIIVGLCVLLVSVIVIAVVLSKSLKNGSSTPPNSTTTTTAAPSPTPTASIKGIRTNSSIAATWFRSGDGGNGYSIRVYYQDSDDFIRESAIDSQSGTWKVTKLPVKAKPRSPLAAWSVPDSGTFVGGNSIFYLDNSSMLSEYWFDHHGQNRTGTLNSQAIFADSSSALSAHHGLAGSGIIYQDIAGNLHLITDTIKGTPSLLNNITDAAIGSSLSLISYVKKEDATPIWLLFYQGKDQLLRSVSTNGTSPWVAADMLELLPKKAPLTSFAYGSYNASGPYIDVIYPSPPHSLVVDYLAPDKPWKTGTIPSSLRDIDDGSAVAGISLGRLYVLANGTLAEFILEGSEWKRLGTVPTMSPEAGTI